MNDWKLRLRQAREAKGLNKTEFAKLVGVSNPTVTDWEKSIDTGGIKEVSGQNLTRICDVLSVAPNWLLYGDGAATAERAPLVRAIHPDDEPPDDVIYVPESRIEFSGGNGRVAQYELVEDEEPATYRLSWFQKYGIKPDRVRRFRVSGHSMEPMLYPRDTILVNLDETAIVDGKLYAIRYGDELRVKYLFRRLGGVLILRSVNPDYKDEEVPPELAQEHISVIGRVRDRSGTGGL